MQFPRFRGVVANTLLSVATRTLGLVLAFFSLGLVSRSLGPAGAGEYFTALAFAGIFNVFANLGLYQALLRDLGEPGANEGAVLSAFFSLRVISLVAVLGVASPLASFLFPYAAAVRWDILIASWGYVALSGSALFVAVFQKRLRMQHVALAELVSRVVQVGLTLVFLAHGYGVSGALAAMFCSGAVNLALLAAGARTHIPYRFMVDVPAWRRIVGATYPIALSTIFSFIYFKVDSLMLSVLKTPYDVGVYGLAYKLLEILVAYPPMYVGLLVPLLAHSMERDRAAFTRTVQQATDTITLLAFPMLAGGIVLAGGIIPVFGSGYDASVGTLRILLGATFAIFFGTIYANLLIVVRRQATLARIYFWAMLGNIAANYVVIPRWSYTGAAWTTLLTEGAVTCAMVIVLKRSGWLATDFRIMPRAALAAAGMTALLKALPGAPVWISVTVGAAAYGVLAVALGAIPSGMLRRGARVTV